MHSGDPIRGLGAAERLPNPLQSLYGFIGSAMPRMGRTQAGCLQSRSTVCLGLDQPGIDHSNTLVAPISGRPAILTLAQSHCRATRDARPGLSHNRDHSTIGVTGCQDSWDASGCLTMRTRWSIIGLVFRHHEPDKHARQPREESLSAPCHHGAGGPRRTRLVAHKITTADVPRS
jgi:hypothetical protein